MTDINVDELIAEARWVADEHEGAEWEPDAIAMIHRLADALVQAQGSADEWWKQYDAERQRTERIVAEAEAIREAYLRFWGAHSSRDIERIARPEMPDTPTLDKARERREGVS